jgi:hypothetical protein
MDYRRSAGQPVALAVLLLAGCASTQGLPSGRDPQIAYFQRESQKINDSERRCISEASASSENRVGSVTASPEASNDNDKEQIASIPDKRLNTCRTNASHEREALSERERNDYRDDAQEQRDRRSLMAVLTSRPH